jgi:NAD(P)-dependent dehydrogenase (short-subunit alcohol dehydrogenase family)
LPRIDIAILNAGLRNETYAIVPATKHEITIQVNYLSTALLAILLLPILKSKKVTGVTHSRPPVLSIVGSDLAYSAKIETKSPLLQQFNNPKTFRSFPWYSNSKLLLVFFVAKLSELVSPDDVIVNIANPGMTKGTAFFRGASKIFVKIMAVAQFLLARSVAVGASTYLDAALAHGKESHGSFMSEWTTMP